MTKRADRGNSASPTRTREVVKPDLGRPASRKPERTRHGGGRPTKLAALERDERLLEIATTMFMEQGFEATSMDALAEAAAIGKATLYARYADKTALFAAVLRRRILAVYGPLEEEFSLVQGGADLGETLRAVARRLLARTLAPDAAALGRILATQGLRFPELGQLAVREGSTRQIRLVATILARFADHYPTRMGDPEVAADLFLSITLGRAAKAALYGVPVDEHQLEQRLDMAVDVFLNGYLDKA